MLTEGGAEESEEEGAGGYGVEPKFDDKTRK